MSPQLVVADLDHSVEFYMQQLGFEIDFRYEDFYVGIIKDGFSIHLKAGMPFAEERHSRKENEHLDIVFLVENIDNLYAELSDKSVTIVQSPMDMPYGREFYIADPDGYIIAFLEQE
jgi:predicted enzyme related to lactoylglutathione lyase